MSTPIVIAHRGDATNYQENSLPAIEAALAGGVLHVECDLQLNATGDLLLLHDADLQRTHQSGLSVFEYVRSREPILPTVEELLALATRYPQATFYFEVKHDSIDRWGNEKVLEAVASRLAGMGRHTVFCRSLEFAEQARQAGFASIGIIVREWSDAMRRQLTRLSPDYLVVNIRRVPDRDSLWPGTWRWAVYEIGDAATAKIWGDRGADFVISFDPVKLQQQLQAGEQ